MYALDHGACAFLPGGLTYQPVCMLGMGKSMEMDCSDSCRFAVLEFHNLLPVCIQEVGEPVALAVWEPSRELVSPPFSFEI